MSVKNYSNKIASFLIDSNKRNYVISKKLGKTFKPRLLYPDFPRTVLIEISNVCNLNCIHCPQEVIQQEPDYVKQYIDFELYKKIVDEVIKYPRTLFRPFGGGEPLMHPKFLEMVRYAKEKGVKHLSVNTNGILMNEKKTRELIEAGIDEIEFSVDGFTEETYRKIRKNKYFYQIKENIMRTLELRKKLNRKVHIIVSIVEMSETQHEIDAFRSYWERIVDHVTVRPFSNKLGMVKDKKCDYQKDMLSQERWPCPYLWDRVLIHWSGKVLFCFHDWRGTGVVDDMNDKSIQEIWTGEIYEGMRKLHMNSEHNKIPLCKLCDETMDWVSVEW